MSSNYYGQSDPYRQPSPGVRPAPAPQPPSFDYADPAEATRLAQPTTSYQNPPAAALAPANQTNQYAQPLGGSGYGLAPSQPTVLVRIGSMVVTDTEVHTPAGTIPLSRARFTFVDQSYSVRKTPTWATIVAIVGFFVVTFFSLFFLLVKEVQTTGQVVVGVYTNDGFNYAEPMYVQNFAQVQDAAARINYANEVAYSSS